MKEYIEREAAIREFTTCGALFVHDESGCKAIISRLLQIPAADVRPVVRSKWIKMKFFPDWECEKCGSVVGNTDDPWNYYHFCPNCGADMREES